jgi:hypothetical protein
MKIFFVILSALTFSAQAQEKSMTGLECYNVMGALSRTAVEILRHNHLDSFHGKGSVYRKDNKFIELNCNSEMGPKSTVTVYTEAEYQQVLNRRAEEYQRQAQLRKQQESTLLKSIGL